jgi:hypothetical protein
VRFEVIWRNITMPRKTTPDSIVTTLKRQAAQAVVVLQQEITRRAKELDALKEEATQWLNISGPPASSRKAAPAQRHGKQKGRRLDWNALLVEMPPTFTAKDVAQRTGKPLQQVYAAASRWFKDKKIKKTKDGYRKTAAGNAAGADAKQEGAR